MNLGAFIRSVDVDNAGRLHRLVGEDADRSAVKAGKTGDNTGGMKRHRLKENAVIDYRLDNFLHVIRMRSLYPG